MEKRFRPYRVLGSGSEALVVVVVGVGGGGLIAVTAQTGKIIVHLPTGRSRLGHRFFLTSSFWLSFFLPLSLLLIAALLYIMWLNFLKEANVPLQRNVKAS